MYYELLLYAVTGKLTIFFLQKFAFSNSRRKKLLGSRFLTDLFECDLCLGVWVFTGLSVAFNINLIDLFYVPVLSWILTGMVASFIVHVFSNGWKALYNVTIIGSN